MCFIFGDFLVMIAAITTFVASIVLIFGLKRSAAGLILPWIIINVVDTVGGMSIFIIKVASYKTQVNPAKVTAAVCYFILTIYFVISVNAYYRALRRQKRLALQILKSNSTLNTSGKTIFYFPLNRCYFWNWCIRSAKEITETIFLWWGETNYHSEVPRWRGTPLNPLLGATVTPLILDAVLKTKSCVSHWIFNFFLK